MSIIRPVTDLRNYAEVLKACQVESPVFLTKKGSGHIGCSPIIDELHGSSQLLLPGAKTP